MEDPGNQTLQHASMLWSIIAEYTSGQLYSFNVEASAPNPTTLDPLEHGWTLVEDAYGLIWYGGAQMPQITDGTSLDTDDTDDYSLDQHDCDSDESECDDENDYWTVWI